MRILNKYDQINEKRKIYDDKFFTNFYEKLGPVSEQQDVFEGKLIYSCILLENRINDPETSDGYKTYIQRVSAFRKKILSARDHYSNFLEEPMRTSSLFFENLDELYLDGKYENFFFYLHDKRTLDSIQYNPKNLFEFFDALIEAADKSLQEKESYVCIANPIYEWLRDMQMLFENYSSVKFTEGKYTVENGHWSKCVGILYMLIKPLKLDFEEVDIGYKLKTYKLKSP